MIKKIRARFLRPDFPRAALTPDNLEFWVGWEAQINRLVRGLVASSNAHYLITGYPGVGKSSLVSRVISDWRRLCLLRDNGRVLIFNLQFAAPQSPEDIVRKLIGKVYFGSIDGQFSPNKQLAERLQLTFIQAHSKSLKEVQSQKTNNDEGGEVGLKLPTLPIIGTDLKFSLKRTKETSRSLEIQREYNLSAAINDLESVIHFLTKLNSFKVKRIWPFRKKIPTGQPRVLIIFDQIDDLTELQQLSSLFRIPNASFMVLGGIKLKEQVSSAQDKGMQVLDEFQEEYIACQWNEAGQILTLLVSEDDFGSKRFSEYCNYLNFFAQGLPRRVFAGIDTHTDFKDGEFYLQLTESEATRVRLCAKLHRVLWRNRKRILGEYIDNVQSYRRDKALRGAYHLTDQIFRVTKFTYQEATTVATQLSDAIIHNERERVLRNLLRTLSDEGLILNHGNFYTISETVLKQIRRIPNWLKDGFVDAHDLLAKLDTDGSNASLPTGTPLTEPLVSFAQPGRGRADEARQDTMLPDSYKSLLGPTQFADFDKYRIVRLLGKGGMGVVYLAEDKVLKRNVALGCASGM